MDSAATYSTANVCDFLSVSERQLGFWVKTGIVSPVFISRTHQGGHEYLYTAEQVTLLSVIIALKGKRMSLQVIRTLLPSIMQALLTRPVYLIVNHQLAIPSNDPGDVTSAFLRKRWHAYLIEIEYFDAKTPRAR